MTTELTARVDPYADMNAYLRPGLRFIGRGHWDGLLIRIEQVDPETDLSAGAVQIFVERRAACELEGVRGSIVHYRERERIYPGLADAIERRATEPCIEVREVNWFRQWLNRGLIEEAE